MKFKFHFGHGIMLAFVLFAGMILNFVIRSFDVPINMVTKNYYEEEGQVNAKAEQIRNTQPYASQIAITLTKNQLAILQMPTQMIGATGVVHFYRPSDEHQDLKYELHLNADAQQVFPLKKLAKGYWTVILTWSKASKDYFIQKDIYIP